MVRVGGQWDTLLVSLGGADRPWCRQTSRGYWSAGPALEMARISADCVDSEATWSLAKLSATAAKRACFSRNLARFRRCRGFRPMRQGPVMRPQGRASTEAEPRNDPTGEGVMRS